VAESVIRLSVINDASPKLRAVNKDATKLSKTVKNSNGVLNNQSKSLKHAALGWLGVGAGAKAATPGIVGAGAALATALAPIAALTTGMAALTGVIMIMAKQDAASAALRTLGVNAEELVPKLKTVSEELGHQFNQTELTIAAYDVASAGFTDAADAAMVLKASALAAKAGMADLATTGDAVTTILNAWKLSASEAESVADKMQQTVADGKIKIAEYASNIGKVATTAAQLKIPLSEVNAAIALATKSGVNSERAFTGINAALAQIAGGKAGKKLGMDISAATLESEGLLETMRRISEVPVGEQIKALGREGHAAMGPVLAALEEYEELLKNQENSANVARNAANEQAMTIGGAWKELTSVVSNLFSSQSELSKSVALLIRMTTGGIKLIAWLLQPVFDLMSDIAWLVNKTIEGIQHLYDIAPAWAKNMMNPGGENPMDKEKPKGKEKDPKKDPAVDSLTKQVELTKMLDDGFKAVGKTITQSLAAGIKGLIKGTQSLGEVLTNIATKITDMLLDMAISSAFKWMGFPTFASGGKPPVGKPSVVGEKGPELFVPRQAGTIIPNHELGGGGGSVNISVNVDASGSSVEGDGNQAAQLGNMLGQAIQAELVRQKRPGGLLAV